MTQQSNTVKRLYLTFGGWTSVQCLVLVLLQVTYGTWFGANVEFIHGIQVGSAGCSRPLLELEHSDAVATVIQHFYDVKQTTHILVADECSAPNMLMNLHLWLLQMLPFTPISEQLLTRDWVATEYPIVAKALPTAAQGWKVCQQMLWTSTCVDF